MKTAQASTLLFAFWLILTGSLGLLDLALGVVVSLFLGAWAARFLWPADAPALTPRQAGRFLLYIPRLLTSVVMAALQVAEVVLDPRMPVDPVVISHRTSFTRDISRVAYANSITLTPGTLAVDIDSDTFYVHCLAEHFATDIATGDLERRVLRVFEE
ncbi:MAG: Na+/H+ antiporter subunit E [Anaerosomatales bacterium]|nr:Na+/H+ antiporter subunit E [Anaerosomatales bacterium]MDT8434005.1 Na+/H+ antiporter subunit E [Anaerosomatales bacterium]